MSKIYCIFAVEMKSERVIYVVDGVPYAYLSDIILEYGFGGLYSFLSRHGWDGDYVEYGGKVISRHRVRLK